MTENLVECRNLTLDYPVRRGLFHRVVDQRRAVDDVSLSVQPGEVMGLVGESGSGKSTIGRLLIGAAKPTEGHVFFEGDDVTQPSARRARELRPKRQLVFQDPTASLNPWQTVGATLEEALVVNGWSDRRRRRTRIAELLSLVRLETPLADRFAHELSGGQRQRVCIARALATEPSFIVADEALASLDVSIQARVADLLLDLRDELGVSYLFITHDLAMAGYVCDRIAVLQAGRIVEQGGAETVLHAPTAEYTRKLLAAAPAPPHNDHRVTDPIAGEEER